MENVTPQTKTDKDGEDTSILFKQTTDNGTAKNNNLKDWVTPNRQVQKETKTLEGGKSIATFDGGDLQPIMFKFVNAGERIESWRVKKQTRILAPKVPTTDAPSITLRAGFVPMTHMVTNYDEIKANKKQVGRTLSTALPTMVFNVINTDIGSGGGTGRLLQTTEMWKYKTASFYLPNDLGSTIPVSVLPIRAYHEFRNAFCRNKMYQPETARFTEATVTATEKGLITASGAAGYSGYGAIHKDQTRNNYYTNIKNSLEEGNPLIASQQMNSSGAIVTQEQDFMPLQKTNATGGGDIDTNRLGKSLITSHIDYQNAIAEYRRRTNDAIKNDWDIIAELGGTTAVKTDRPEYLGEITTKLNYQQITQTAPSDGTTSQLGSTGAYSVTFDDETLFGYKEFQQDGIIIITATVSSDNTYEAGIHRTAMIANTTDMFNPEIAKKQQDVLLKPEVNGTVTISPTSPASNTIGFKPKYTEFDTLPNLCIRDARTKRLTKQNGETSSASQWHNMKSDGGNDVTANDQYFRDSTQTLIARNSLQANVGFTADDQILLASQHEVVITKHKKLGEIKTWGVEN